MEDFGKLNKGSEVDSSEKVRGVEDDLAAKKARLAELETETISFSSEEERINKQDKLQEIDVLKKEIREMETNREEI